MINNAAAESVFSLGSTSRLWIRTASLAGLALAAGMWTAGQLDHREGQVHPGHLQARMHTVIAEQPARLQSVAIQPGQRVKAGETLLTLIGEHAVPVTADRQQQAALAEQQAIRAKAAADLELHWRRRELQSEIFQTQFKLAGLRQEKLHHEVEQIAWRESLLSQDVFEEPQRAAPIFKFLSESSGDVPEERMRAMLREDAAVSAARALASQILLCEQRLEELKAMDRGLEVQVRLSHGVEAAEELCRRAAEQVDAVAEVSAAIPVLSPGYGLVGVTKKQPGDLVGPGDVLVQILDDERRTIEVDIPSRDVVRFTPGQQIRLEFPGPQQRNGIVSSIAPQTSEVASGQPTMINDALVRLVIEPVGKLWPAVSIGSRVLVFEP